MSQHTKRTLKYLRVKGYECDTDTIVERWVRNPRHPAGGFRKDYKGIIDIIVFDDTETIGIQSCGSDFAVHNRTILSNPNSKKWLRNPDRKLILIGWRKVVKRRGSKQKIFKPRVKVYELEDFV